MTEEELLAAFVPRGVIRGNELYLTPADALELLELCRTNDCAMVGVEAFRLEREATVPMPGLIADFSKRAGGSWHEFAESSYESARAFLSRLVRDSGLRVAVVILSMAEWRQSQ